ncbi:MULTISPECIES: sodium:solute symporter family protein [Prosthecochloris]|uniref:Na+:solute symporter n=1 Tax=Prosthecochloris vibrioformis TaxID=1098 RepID=A0A5C4S0D1_PROVB|nr:MULTISPECIES: sodium:solute symporter family protein [Prosthecochloris]ANT65077.1 Na(+)/glucose symporter [Prosthecochloris sp. CIB 2401]TNJ36864.1 Na+:solute symporter [Prosthecochloris vibrioformis]
MTALDFTVIAGYLGVTLLIGLLFSARASKSVDEFFLSGRKLPWWIAGTGMVATTFAADTPLAVTGLVAKHGIAGNWLWWTFVSGGMLTVFFFARLWRRANILTDLEFIELRYSGKSASFLRGFKAVYFGLFINAIIIGWVNLAMLKIATIMLPGIQPELVIIGCVLLTTIYSGLGGLWGVTVTDTIQFVISMAGCTILAVLAMQAPEIQAQGGLQGALPAWMFEFFPTISRENGTGNLQGALQLTLASFAAMALVQWWASWYPGAEPGGGGYIAQRMMSAKDEKHSLLATLWFIVAHYCIRPWPWIIVGLASLVLFPDLPAAQKEDGFVHVMNSLLPSGLKGLLMASFLAAYMSTLSTHLNWGSSYLVNDLYRRFIDPESPQQRLVLVSRLTTIAVAIFSLYITFYVLETITGAWEFLIQCGAGTGFVLIMRWFWWRLNAWSEITSMAAPFAAYAWITLFTNIAFPESLFIIVLFTIISTLLVTWLTPPTDSERLATFYSTTRVGGILWKPVAATLPNVKGDTGFIRLFLDWIAGIVLVYGTLFGTGKLIFHDIPAALPYFIAAVLAAIFIYQDLNRRGWESIK